MGCKVFCAGSNIHRLTSGGADCAPAAATPVLVHGTMVLGVTLVLSNLHCDQLTSMRPVPSHSGKPA